MVQLLQGDCLELLRDVPAGSVDMVLADLPYQTTQISWDDGISLPPLWEQLKRVTKENAAILLFSQMPFTAELYASNPKMWRYDIIWEKTQGTGFLNARKMPLRKHEIICVFYRHLPWKSATFWKARRRGKMYLTYDEYVAYGGTLPAAQFPAAELQARKQIDKLTFSRVTAMAQVPEEVKLAMVKLITADAAADVATLTENPLVQSFNNDGYSESYGAAADQVAVIQKAAADVVSDLLYGVVDDNGTPLLYRGLDA